MRGQDPAYSTLMRELWGSPLQWNTKKTYLQVAEKLGVDEETVRNRVKRLMDSGFLLGWRLVPNPTLLGRTPTSILLEFEDPASKEDQIPRLSKMDGLINIASIYDKGLLLTLFDDPERSSSKNILALEIGREANMASAVGLQPSTFRMTKLDWEIVEHLLRDADKKLAEVAMELRVSERTVKRRLNLMRRESAVLIMPLVDLRKAEGVSYQLIVQGEEGKQSAIDKLVASRIENLVFKASDLEKGTIFGFNGANVAEGNEILNWVKQQPGVVSARMNIVERVVHVYDWLDREVKRRVNERRASLSQN